MKSLQAQRGQILQQMAQLETMEYGSLHAEYRPAAGGGTTGPYYKHQVWEQGKNLSQRIPAAEAPALQTALTNRQRCEALVQEYIALTVQQTRRRTDDETRSKEKRQVVATAVAAEAEAFLTLARQRLTTEGWTTSDWVETGLRAALLRDGRRLLEGLLNDPTLPLPDDASRPGEKATAAVPRTLETLFGPLTLRRNYYHAAAAGTGRYPLDAALKLEGPYTPALARWMSRAGAQTGFASGSEDLRVYAGLAIDGRQIHRLLQTIGPAIQRACAAAPTEKLAAPLPVLYVEVDGTGAPMVPAALVGRKGQQPDGTAKTREVKLGCVFTQHTTDAEGQPVRDAASTTYLCGLETAGDFGTRLRREALRRGLGQSQRVVLLGDGAAWVWELGRVNFSSAIEILDYYHAREHLTRLVEALVGPGPAAAELQDRWESWLWEGQVPRLRQAARAQGTDGGAPLAAAVTTELGYFEKNQARMRYGEFRDQGLFIGSGVVEAGCKTVVGQRAKQSGMCWTEAGLLAVLHTRCALLGGQFDTFWNHRNDPAQAIRTLAA